MADRHGRYGSGRYRGYKRPLVLLAALVLLIALGVGATVGLLHTGTEPLQNDFTYGKVSSEVLESFEAENGVYAKRDVRIKNTGNTDAYIRVLLVFTWKDADGNVFVNKPELDRDYQINLALSNGWIVAQNGIGAYIYYKYPVAAGAETPVLIDSVRLADGVTGPENGKYSLSVEVVADAVQANPASAVQQVWEGAKAGADGALIIEGGTSYENDPTEAD